MRQIHGVDRATSPPSRLRASFALLTIRFRSLVACSRSTILIGCGGARNKARYLALGIAVDADFNQTGC